MALFEKKPDEKAEFIREFVRREFPDEEVPESASDTYMGVLIVILSILSALVLITT